MEDLGAILLTLGGIGVAIGAVLLAAGPYLGGGLATRSSQPKPAKRASGPDRMRELIASEQLVRTRRARFGATIRWAGFGAIVTGIGLFAIGTAVRIFLLGT